MSRTRSQVWTARWWTLLAVVAGTLAAPLVGVAEAAPPPALVDRIPVAPGLVREVYRYQGGGGRVDVQALRFRLDDPSVDLRPELGDGTVPGMEATHEVTRRLGEGAVAAVNGSFFSWSATPAGDPRGLLIREGAYLSEPEKGERWKGGFGITASGTHIVGNPGFKAEIVLPGPCPPKTGNCLLNIGGINRHPLGPIPEQPHRREMALFTPEFGASTGTKAGTVEVTFPGVVLRPQQQHSATVGAITSAGNAPIPPGGVVLAATGNMGDELRKQLVPGSVVTLELGIAAGWSDLRHAVQGGPLILQSGRPTSHASWQAEGFSPSRHSDKRHPRTIAGFTASGEMMLVTVDGRTSRSPGLTMAETQELMQHLGAVDAVHMDGGGSTTMVVDDAIVNRPCCDSAGYRRVSTNLVLFSPIRSPDVRRLGTADPYTTAAALADSAWGGRAGTVVLASGEAFPDGLAGGPLAHRYGGPLLLTKRTSIPSVTLEALRRLAPRQVLVMGGDAAISNEVFHTLERNGFKARRFFGPDRVATSVSVARHLGAPTGTAFLASAESWPDSVSAATPAALANAPLLLTYRAELHPDVLDALRFLKVRKVVLAGGDAAVSGTVEQALRAAGFATERVAGPDRYATSAALATWSEKQGGVDKHAVAIANGHRFQEALIGGPFGARERKAVLLVDPNSLSRSGPSNGWLTSHDLQLATVLGDRSVVSSNTAWEIQKLLDR